MVINTSQTFDHLVSNSSTTPGGSHTLTFYNGQVLVINDVNSNVTINFNGGGGSTPV